MYSACLLRVLRVRAHGRLVVGIVAQDMPILHNALSGERCAWWRERARWGRTGVGGWVSDCRQKALAFDKRTGVFKARYGLHRGRGNGDPDRVYEYSR